MIRNRIGLLTLVASIGLAACGDSTGPAVGELSAAESQSLGGAVLSAVFLTSASVPAPAPAPAGPALVTYASEIDDTFSCAGGGSVGVAASAQVDIDDTSGDTQIQWSMTQIHAGCVVTGEGGQSFTLTGDPSMNVAFTVSTTSLGTEWAGSVQGNVQWVTGQRTGSCLVDLEFGGSSTPSQGLTAEMLGTVCGFTIDHSFVVTT